jgi:Isochorismate synthase
MGTSSVVSKLKYSERELISSLLSRSQERQNPTAVWRLPGSRLTHMVISDRHSALDPDELLEDLDTGFLFAPFDKSKKRIFLKADRLFTFENGELKTSATSLDEKSSLNWLLDQSESFKSEKFKPDSIEINLHASKRHPSFTEIIESGIAEIEKGTFQKIVPSRTMTITLPASFDVVESFQRLSSTYPQALISFVNIPGVGSWLGASPELLISVKEKATFKTVALAGTLPYQAGLDIKSVAWTQKEIEEQALVERYVISCFKKVRLREYDEYGPKTVVAGNLMHLKSEFTVDMKATNFPQIGSVMLDLLHPTSAVCGMPLETSLQFLREHEPYDREFYAGYLGPVNVNDNIDLFVNIRCMQISGNQGILYAGAGVTIDSTPSKELAETEMKFNTLLNIVL